MWPVLCQQQQQIDECSIMKKKMHFVNLILNPILPKAICEND